MENSAAVENQHIAEWVTIIAIFLFACYPHEMIYLSETSLGKLFFASLVLYYTMIDTVYGLVACCIVIVYYQLDLYRSYVSLHRDTLLRESMVQMEQSLHPDSSLVENKIVEGYTCGDSAVYAYSSEKPSNDIERLFLKGNRNRELLDVFRKEHCKNGRLMHMGSVVPKEMSDHVFREIQFDSDSAKCNPCNSTCEFSIVEDRVSREDALIRPSSSRDEPIDWNQFFGHYVVKPVSSIVDDARYFGEKVSRYSGSIFNA